MSGPPNLSTKNSIQRWEKTHHRGSNTLISRRRCSHGAHQEGNEEREVDREMACPDLPRPPPRDGEAQVPPEDLLSGEGYEGLGDRDGRAEERWAGRPGDHQGRVRDLPHHCLAAELRDAGPVDLQH